MNIVCVSCHVEMAPLKNGAPVIVYAEFGAYKIYAADLWCCPLCGAQALGGFSDKWYEHYQPTFARQLEIARAHPWHVCVYESQAQREEFEHEDQP